MKIATILGARPQFIKAAPLSKILKNHFDEIIIHTGQHYSSNMSDIFFEELDIPTPKYNLSIGSSVHYDQIGRMIIEIGKVLDVEKPDAVIVYGDTNSTLAGAIAAASLNIKIIHVESGLRSFNMLMPEERNRVLVDHISFICFCPTENAVSNLKMEKIDTNIYNTGDIMLDSTLYFYDISKTKYNKDNWSNELKFIANKDSFNQNENYYLATIHRAENSSNSKLSVIFNSLNELDSQVIFPMHPRLNCFNIKYENYKNIIFIQPVGYLFMLYMMKGAKMVITDSGGLQKESYFLRIPCTTLREQTEWIETLKFGWNKLSNIDFENIIETVKRPQIWNEPPDLKEFGNGNAASKIVDILKGVLK